ncbi:MAG: sensor histidine kinase [Chloroflexi bacterium]|nr:sensor histidine kinase [Chloroflexota bacterium]
MADAKGMDTKVKGPSAAQYRRSAYQFIAFYRYLAFAVGAVLMIALPLGRGEEPQVGPLAALAIIGLYTAFKVAFPTRESLWNLRSYAVLVVDVLAALASVMTTGGLDSGLLLYTFTPIIIAASFYNERVALVIAVVFIADLGLGHVALSQVTDSFVWVLDGNRLSLFAAYSVASLLAATMTYRANLSLRQRIERSSIIEERRRLRREIHDGIAQSLGYLNLKAGLIRASLSQPGSDPARILAELDDVKKATEEAYTDIRESIDSLTFTADRFSLVESIRDYLKDFSERTGIAVEFRGYPAGALVTQTTELQALRIVQEALSNVRKHACATNVEVALSRLPDALEVVIRDNGTGMDVSSQPPRGHHGIEVMRERAEGLGGEISIQSAPGQGTVVKAVLPLEGKDAA